MSLVQFDNDLLKPIEGYEDQYSITNDGRIWSHEKIVGRKNKSKGKKLSKWLKPTINKGYLVICLVKNKKRKMFFVHRLVAQAYIPNPNNKPHINHLSGIKTNNHVSNLEWVIPLENSQHATINGLMNGVQRFGENNFSAKLTWEQVNEIRNNHNNESHKNKVWEKYGIGRTQYYNILNNWAWTK